MVRIFADEGISGTQAKKRPDFMKMIRMCKQGKIDMILTKSISRFARNNVDCLNYIRLLKELGISVIFEKEGIDTKKMATEMTISMLGAFSQAESESLSKNVTWGKRQSIKNGKVFICYKSFLGYKKGVDDTPEIEPEEAKIVIRIYDNFLAGMSLQQIKQGLEVDGILTPTGKTIWRIETLRSILRNEKYKGDAILQKTYVTDYLTKKTKKNNGEIPMYYVSNNHPAIIEADKFDRVQEELVRRTGKRRVAEKSVKTEQGKYSSKYALTELLVCGSCGTAYRRVTWAKNGTKRVVWRCISRLEYGTKYCKDSPTIEESKLQEAILMAITEYVGGHGAILSTLKTNIGHIIGGNNNDEEYILVRRIEKLKTMRSELIAEVAKSDDKDCYDEKFKQISDSICTLNNRLNEIQSKEKMQNTAALRLEEIFQKLYNCSDIPIAYNDSVARQLIGCVRVMSAEKITVTFKDGITVEVKL